jgi:hypothetical protein
MTVERSPEEQVRYLLKRLALEFTETGTLEELADDIGVHRTTMSAWMSAGRVPDHKARYLQRRYSNDFAPAHELCPGIEPISE